MRFQDKVAIVTGAASGIGRALAQRLASEGASVALIDRNEAGLTEVAAALPDQARVWFRALDVASETEVEKCVADVFGKFGRIDVLCNNAGIAGGDYSAITETDVDVWRQILSVNIMGAVHFTKYAARIMRDQRAGAIVNTA